MPTVGGNWYRVFTFCGNADDNGWSRSMNIVDSTMPSSIGGLCDAPG